MKKLFISCPMRGLSDELITKTRERLHTVAEAHFNEKLEVIDSFFSDEPKEDIIAKPVWYLGKSLQKLSEADYMISVDVPDDSFNGVNIECEVAERYGIKYFTVDADDIVGLEEVAKIVNDEYNRLINEELDSMKL